MLIGFFQHMKRCGVAVSVREWLDLLAALERCDPIYSTTDFYYLCRAVLIKNESHYDRFDQAYGAFFSGLDSIEDLFEQSIPEEWLRDALTNQLTDEEKAAIEAMGGLDELMEQFKQRMEEQKERHQGGNKWIGTGGTSPFGAGGYNPAGFRIGGPSRNKRAVKVWENRHYRDLDDSLELGTRNIKMALRKLRKFARQGAVQELDLDKTIQSTADHAGMLDIHMRPERHNAIKVLLLFDVGGSMDPFIETCEQLFSAAKAEFKHMQWFYFHNCVYDAVWTQNGRSKQHKTPTWDVIHKYAKDYRLIFVGDAAMAPYELAAPAGNIEGWNTEAGEVWVRRLTDHFDKHIWLNPAPKPSWEYTWTTQAIRQLMGDRMYELTLAGLEDGIKALL